MENIVRTEQWCSELRSTAVTAQASNADQPSGWTKKDWQGLLLAIQYQKCTPFLGAGACAGVLPLGRDIAVQWARDWDYPFENSKDLVRVAQYVAVQDNAMTPKLQLKKEFEKKGPPDFDDPNEPHRVIAELKLPIYVTTNYDSFMYQALARAGRAASRVVCQWHLADKRYRTAGNLEASVEAPLVYHLHGYLEEPETMVLTEDDYLEFLMRLSEDDSLVPRRIEQAFADTALLFLGYSLEDMNLKVIFRKLANYLKRNEGARHVAVQLAPHPGDTREELIEKTRKQREHLEKTYGFQKVKVYWGSCAKFAEELRREWKEFRDGT